MTPGSARSGWWSGSSWVSWAGGCSDLGWPLVLLVVVVSGSPPGCSAGSSATSWARDFVPRLAAAQPGDLVPIELTLRARASLLTWPFLGVVPVLLGSSLGPDDEEPTAAVAGDAGRRSQRSGSRSTASSSTTSAIRSKSMSLCTRVASDAQRDRGNDAVQVRSDRVPALADGAVDLRGQVEVFLGDAGGRGTRRRPSASGVDADRRLDRQFHPNRRAAERDQGRISRDQLPDEPGGRCPALAEELDPDRAVDQVGHARAACRSPRARRWCTGSRSLPARSSPRRSALRRTVLRRAKSTASFLVLSPFCFITVSTSSSSRSMLVRVIHQAAHHAGASRIDPSGASSTWRPRCPAET